MWGTGYRRLRQIYQLVTLLQILYISAWYSPKENGVIYQKHIIKALESVQVKVAQIITGTPSKLHLFQR